MTIWSAELIELDALFEVVKNKLPDLEKELERLVKTDDENMVLIYARRCLEVMVTDLCETELKRPRKSEPLKGIMDKLNKEEVVPSYIITSMQNLNSLSTYGAHPKEYDPRQVKPVLNDLSTVIEWYLKYKNIEYKGKIEELVSKGSDNIDELSPVVKQKKKSVIIVSGILLTGIIIVLALDIFNIFNKDKFEALRNPEGKISVAIMPFENLSGDTIYDVWQNGLQNLLITTLSNSEELSVRQYQTINKVLENSKNINFASLSPSLKNDLANKLETRTFILGNILKAGNKIRVNAQLMDAETEEIYKTYQVNGDNENDFFIMADSLSGLIKNYIEIKKITDNYNSPEIRGISFTNSSEAFKYYIHGFDAFKDLEMGTAADWFEKAIEIDSTFINAYVLLSHAYQLMGNNIKSKYWFHKAYKKRDRLPTEEKLILDQLNAYYFETPIEEIKYVHQLIEMDELNSLYWHQLGFAHYKLQEYEDALINFEQALEIHKKWGTDYRNPFIYFLMGNAYHKMNEHKKEKEVLEIGRTLFPQNIYILEFQAICALTHGEEEKANNLITEYKSIRKNIIHCTEAMISSGIGYIYSSANLFDEAEKSYRQALQFEPENPLRMNDLAWFLIDNDINIDEGVDLVERALKLAPDSWYMLDTKGWGLYKQSRYEEALEVLKRSWDIKPAYSHSLYQHIQETEKALAERIVSRES